MKGWIKKDKAFRVPGFLHKRICEREGCSLEEAEKGSDVALSIRGIEIGKDIGKDETLFVNLPESHVRQLMAKFLNELTSDQKEVLREYIKMMRTHSHPWWGM
ncbi:MAG: hypothetical protein ACFE8P_17730 [Promethearchaeota archaeon]